MASDSNPAAVLYLNRNFKFPGKQPKNPETTDRIPWTSYRGDFYPVALTAQNSREEVVKIIARLRAEGIKIPRVYKPFFDRYFSNQTLDYREDEKDFDPEIFKDLKDKGDFAREAVKVLLEDVGKDKAEQKIIADGILSKEKVPVFFVYAPGQRAGEAEKKPMTEEEEKTKELLKKDREIEQRQAAEKQASEKIKGTFAAVRETVKEDKEAIAEMTKKQKEDDMESVDSFVKNVLVKYEMTNIRDKFKDIDKKMKTLASNEIKEYIEGFNNAGSDLGALKYLGEKLGMDLTLEELEPVQPPVVNPQVDFAIDEYDAVETMTTKDDKTPLQLPDADPLVNPDAPPSVLVSEEPTLQATTTTTSQNIEQQQNAPLGQMDPLSDSSPQGPTEGPSGPQPPYKPAGPADKPAGPADPLLAAGPVDPLPATGSTTQAPKKGGPFATKEEPIEHPPKYHKYSIKIYLGSDTRPNYDPELEKNIYSSDLTKDEIIQNINNVIVKYGADLFISGTRKSDTLDELHELTQLQFCLMRHLATGPRFASANIPISQLVSIYNKMTPQQAPQELTPEEARRQGQEDENITSAEEMAQAGAQAGTQQVQSTGSVQVQISPNQALENVINAYREADFTSQGKPRFNESLVASTLGPRPRNIKGPGSMIDPTNNYVLNVPMKIKTSRKSVRII